MKEKLYSSFQDSHSFSTANSNPAVVLIQRLVRMQYLLEAKHFLGLGKIKTNGCGKTWEFPYNTPSTQEKRSVFLKY